MTPGPSYPAGEHMGVMGWVVGWLAGGWQGDPNQRLAWAGSHPQEQVRHRHARCLGYDKTGAGAAGSAQPMQDWRSMAMRQTRRTASSAKQAYK